jgi:hypothetical protein
VLRYNDDNEYGSDGAPGPIRDVNTGKKNKSVDFGRSGSRNVKSDQDLSNANVQEVLENVDLGNEQLNDVVQEIQAARDKIASKAKKEEVDTSQKSKSKGKRKLTKGPTSFTGVESIT